MSRIVKAFLIAVVLFLPLGGQVSAESATISVSVTVLPSPLIAIIEPDCLFVIEAKSTKADCSTTITVAQPTFQFEGWELLLSASEIVNSETGAVMEAKSIKIVGYSSFLVHWGQPVDDEGGPYIPKKGVKHDLDAARTVIAADPGFGIGGYTTTIHFEVKVPPKTTPGTYVPTLVVQISNEFDGKHSAGTP